MATKTKSGALAPDLYVPNYKLIANSTGNKLPLDIGTPEKRLRWLQSTKLLLESLGFLPKTEHATSVGDAEYTPLPTCGNE
jgi:hypothetical protein